MRQPNAFNTSVMACALGSAKLGRSRSLASVVNSQERLGNPKFKNRFAEYDFYYPDGTSFIVTMEALLGQREKWTFGEFSALNINDDLKSEMRRVLYWKNK